MHSTPEYNELVQTVYIGKATRCCSRDEIMQEIWEPKVGSQVTKCTVHVTSKPPELKLEQQFWR